MNTERQEMIDMLAALAADINFDDLDYAVIAELCIRELSARGKLDKRMAAAWVKVLMEISK